MLQRDDAGLVELAVPSSPTRWGCAAGCWTRGSTGGAAVFRSTRIGHLGRVGRIEAAVAGKDGLELCGAAYHGIGVAACVADGRAAAERTVEWLRAGPTARGLPGTMPS